LYVCVMCKLLNGFQCTEYVTCESKGSIQ